MELPQSFVVHVPHKESSSKTKWKHYDEHRRSTDKILEDFAVKLKSSPTLHIKLCSQQRRLSRKFKAGLRSYDTYHGDMWASAVDSAKEILGFMRSKAGYTASRYNYTADRYPTPPCTKDRPSGQSRVWSL